MLDKAYSNEAYEDVMASEVCLPPKVGQEYEFYFHTELHKKIILQLKTTLYRHTYNAVNKAVRRYLTHIKAHRIADPVIEPQYRYKQAERKLELRMYPPIPDNPVSLSISTKLFPLRLLSELTSKDIDRLIHCDLTVLGTSDMKAYIDKVRTNEEIIDYEKYNPKRDGQIIEKIHNDVQYLLCEEITGKKELRKITVKCYGDFVGKLQVGDKIRLFGVYSTLEDSKNANEYTYFIEAITIQRVEQRREYILSHSDLETFRNLTKRPEEYFHMLTDSLAPHIYGNHLPKLGILLASIISPKTKLRSNMLLLLEGSPGVGKSEMLKAALELSDNAALVDAPSVSTRGMTYGQEEFNKTKILRAGVLVRHELVLLDELDKMAQGQREELNTATEQQIASYHKTPFDIDQPINVGIIASANPAGGRWKDDRSIMENLGNLENTIIDRYLIIKVDKPENTDAKYDIMLGSIEETDTNPPFTHDQLRGLINHARKIKPHLTEPAKNMVKDFLLKFANIEQSGLADIYIETRKEYDLIRVIHKIGQLLLRDELDEECVKLGIQFYKDCMESIGLRTEAPTAQQMLPKDGSSNDIFWQIYRMLLKDSEDGKTVSESELKEEMDKSGKWNTPEKINEFLDRMKKQKLYEPRVGRIEKV